jgi:hypothetical protein
MQHFGPELHKTEERIKSEVDGEECWANNLKEKLWMLATKIGRGGWPVYKF